MFRQDGQTGGPRRRTTPSVPGPAVCPRDVSRASVARRPSAMGGAVLLEVVLALTLFVSAVSVVSMGLGGASRSVARMDLQARATDMAVTLLSEIEMGLVEPVDYGPETYADERHQAWTWQVAVEPLENVEDFQRIAVTVTHTPSGVMCRLTQLAPVPPLDEPTPFEEEPPMPDAGGAGGGTGALR